MSKLKFIDLFAGIGGFHLAMHDLGGFCVFASEKDAFARKTYEENFQGISPHLFVRDDAGNQPLFNKDITAMNEGDIPDFDLLCAGFPCQPFSQAGLKAGFSDSKGRGNLFFDIARIIKAKNPRFIFLENVRGLLSHDNGNTFAVIKKVLEEDLRYRLHVKIVKASDFGLPQNRPRIFIIGVRGDLGVDYEFPEATNKLNFTMSDILGGKCDKDIGFTLRVGGRGSGVGDRRNWDSYMVDGKEVRIGVEQAKMMQGFPSGFTFPVSSTQAMKQLGNSVAVDAIRACAKNLVLLKNEPQLDGDH